MKTVLVQEFSSTVFSMETDEACDQNLKIRVNRDDNNVDYTLSLQQNSIVIAHTKCMPTIEMNECQQNCHINFPS